MEVLRDYLPMKYSVGSGFITDTFGRRSKQTDVVVNDDTIFKPLPYQGEKALFLCESVACTIEVKSRLTPRELDSALTKIRCTKELRRKHTDGDQVFGSVTKPYLHNTIQAFIFAYGASSRLAKVAERWSEFNLQKAVPTLEQADALVVLDDGMIINAHDGSDDFGVRIDDQSLTGMVAIHTGEDTLMRFFSSLMARLPKFMWKQSNFWDYVSPANYPVCPECPCVTHR
jgi:hypothetical protein